MNFPHCDARVLHAKGDCNYCDAYPERQALREAWGISFTGHIPPGGVISRSEGDPDLPASLTYQYTAVPVPGDETPWLRKLPCPADFNRPPGAGNDHRSWAGNVATSATPVNETATSRMLYDVPREERERWFTRSRLSWWRQRPWKRGHL